MSGSCLNEDASILKASSFCYDIWLSCNLTESMIHHQLLLPQPVKLDKKTEGRGGKELGEEAMAIVGFAESYEKLETVKLKQMVEFELLRMIFFEAQLEMLRNIQDGERRIRSHLNF
ncbi:Trihelix transcription factor ASIL1 [Cardamine amara subsp. amara]|uniref:Trihelix transcription factor ASIL1 n=1 Tax=Cardamine amara subsp. amara TaxID=228776 RepID=A0ABD1BG90_CARAN